MKVLVLTVDPAKRLANALGLERFGNVEVRVPPEAFSDGAPAAGGNPGGRVGHGGLVDLEGEQGAVGEAGGVAEDARLVAGDTAAAGVDLGGARGVLEVVAED